MDLVLGTAQLARPYGVFGIGMAPFDSPQLPQLLLRTSQLLGFSAIDTAPTYGGAERIIGESGVEMPVHTKIAPGLDVQVSLHHSLRLLRRTTVDIAYLHEQLVLDARQESLFAKLCELRADGIVGALGASVYDEDEFNVALEHPEIDVIQLPYNLFDQRFGPERVAEAKKRGKKIYARSIFLQGVLAGDPSQLPSAVSHLGPAVRELRAFARTWGITPLQLALGFARANSGLSGLILGAVSSDNLREIQDASKVAVPKEALDYVLTASWPRWPASDPRLWR